MADKEVRIDIKTTASGGGATQTKAGLKSVSDAALAAGISVDQLEAELKQAEQALKSADVGSKAFRKLQSEVARTKELLKTVKVGDLDAKGLERLSRRLVVLKTRTQDAKQALTQGPRTSWVGGLTDKFKGLTDSIPGASKVKALFAGLSGGAGKAIPVIGALTVAIGGYLSLVKKGIGKVAITEDLEASFETLLGSTQRAIGRIAEMKEIAASTPLTVAGLAQTSRLLETLTDGALGSAESLKVIGDAAAVAQRPGEALGQTMANVALHVGRLKSSLEAGSGEIGESTMRLAELGLISVRTSQRLRELHKEGDKGTEAWDLLEKSLGKFSGEMERRSKTINGLLSTMGDAFGEFAATVASPFVGPFKASISIITASLQGLGKVVERTNLFFGNLGKGASSSIGLIDDSVEEVSQRIVEMGNATANATKIATDEIDALKNKFDEAGERAQALAKHQEELAKLRLRSKLADIEDSDLSEPEKLIAKTKAEIAAGEKISGIREGALEKQLKAQQDRARISQAKLADAEKRITEKQRELEEIDKDAGHRQTFQEQANKRYKYVQDLEAERNKLQEVLASLDPGQAENPLEWITDSLSAGALALAGTTIPWIDSPLAMAERVQQLDDELKIAYKDADRFRKIMVEQNMTPEGLGIVRGEIEKDIEGLTARIQKFSEDDTISSSAAEKTQLAINRFKELEKARSKVLRKEARSKIVDTVTKDSDQVFREAESALEKSRTILEQNRIKQQEEAAKTLQDLAQLTKDDGTRTQFEALAESVKSGDLTGVNKTIKAALRKRSGDVFELGEILRDQVDKFQSFEAAIKATQERVDELRQTRDTQAKQDAKQKAAEAIPDKVAISIKPSVDLANAQQALDQLTATKPVNVDVSIDESALPEVTVQGKLTIDESAADRLKPPAPTTQEVHLVPDALPDPDPVTRQVTDQVTDALPDPDPVTRQVKDQVTIEPVGELAQDIESLSQTLAKLGAAQLSQAVRAAAADISSGDDSGFKPLREALLQSLDVVSDDQSVSDLLDRIRNLETSSDLPKARPAAARPRQPERREQPADRPTVQPPEPVIDPSALARQFQDALDAVNAAASLGNRPSGRLPEVRPAAPEDFRRDDQQQPAQDFRREASPQPAQEFGQEFGQQAAEATYGTTAALQQGFEQVARAQQAQGAAAGSAMQGLLSSLDSAAANQQALADQSAALHQRLNQISSQLSNMRV